MTTLYQQLFEGMEYKCLDGLVKPMIHIDEFASKMGDDADIIVASFYVRDHKAAKDLEHWFETGYQDVLDADTSPGELKPNRYLVYVEFRRRSTAAKLVARILDDLESITEFKPDDWSVKYGEEVFPFSREMFEQSVPLSPQSYRELHMDDEEELNEWRHRAGLDTKPLYEKFDADVEALQVAAGIK